MKKTNIWRISEQGILKDTITMRGNKFLLGNGYMGVRGTLPEYRREECTAITLAGIYDKVGTGWREPVNAPNPLYTSVSCDGEACSALINIPDAHEEFLNFRTACSGRSSIWKRKGAGSVSIKTERFVSRERIHLLVERMELCCSQDSEMDVTTGIDTQVWDINGPHFDKILTEQTEHILIAEGSTHEKGIRVWTAECTVCDFPASKRVINEDALFAHHICFRAEAGKKYIFYKYAAVAGEHSKDTKEMALQELKKALALGYENLKEEHCTAWERAWKNAEVTIEGDDEAMQALNYSLYHLLCIAPRHADSLSIAARGLSGQTYKGAVFWDTEMFMLDFFLNTDPDTAKSLLRYRIDTLSGAKEKAAAYGYEGAFYAWESQEGGYDACSDYNVTDVFTGRPVRTYFKDKQIHISAAVVYGIMKYTKRTGDQSLLLEGGIEVILESARFYRSRMIQRVGRDIYELCDVIGPDEYHERVDNNGYTNRFAKYVLECAVELLKQYPEEAARLGYPVEQLKKELAQAKERLYVPEPDKESGRLEQFNGYFSLEDTTVDIVRSRLLHPKEYWGGANGVASHTQIIKQADVIMWLIMFPGDFSEKIVKANRDYYEPRTEHGSSLSACMYALADCRLRDADAAYPLFMKSAKADLQGGGKEWAGDIYIGGTHPAAAGGAYMNVVTGFAGVHFDEEGITAKPCIPKKWESIMFSVYYKGIRYRITVREDQAKVEEE